MLFTVVSLWIPLSPLLWLLHRQISGNNSSAQRRRSKSRLVNFTDVAGIDTAKAELTEIVACLRGTSNYASLGAKLPKGVLLVGPPGTGKTLLARAVAGEAGVPFFAASASEFVEMFVGRGAARIRELFAEAKKSTPSIVFIDELDAVGGRRGRSFNDERDQTLNQLLTEMDGFDSETGVMVIAATNRPEVLDPALTRPGRISRRVNVEAPDFEGRQQVLAVHMRSTPVEGDAVALRTAIASLTPGFVGADLANVVNEAALLAARQGRASVTFADFKEAVDRAKYGVVENRKGNRKAVGRQLNEWFSSALRPQAKQLRGGEPPEGYRAVPFNG
jgi:ATP-dependent metalloprotease FtsH